jgi:hypothetical protein
MLLVSPTLSQIQRAKKEAREMGVLKNSATNGGGNVCGMLGEILFHSHYGGKRVPKSCRTHDVTLKNGVRVDVKSQLTQNVISRDFVIRIYAPWESRKWLTTKCDVYYFIKIQRGTYFSSFVGWTYSCNLLDDFEFTPVGGINPFDGRRASADEFSAESSALKSADLF